MGKVRRDPFVLVLYGATGDLAKRKLYSALFHLYKTKRIARDFKVVGLSRKGLSDEDFRHLVFESCNYQCNQRFLKKFFFRSVDIASENHLSSVQNYLSDLKKDYGGNVIFYLSLNPLFFESVLKELLRTRLLDKCDESRVAFEKPFGLSLQVCQALNSAISSHFSESKVYRIDHYLNYKTVRNILAVRFSNHFFERIWNKDFVDHVQIIAKEKIGLESRNDYLGDTGVLKDMFQNHLLQLASLVGVEEPDSLLRNDVAKSKVDFFNSIKIDENCFLSRAQYSVFLEDLGRETNRESFFALKLFVDNERWRGVPFYFKSGKNLDEKVTRIYIRLKNIGSKIFRKGLLPNSILINISGDEGVSLRFNVYHHLKDDVLDQVFMSFMENKVIRKKYLHPYERLLYRVIRFDNNGFPTGGEVEACWKVYESVRDKLRTDKLSYYSAGSKGPKEAFNLMKKDGRKWFI